MNSTILKNIFREFAPRLTGLTAAGGGLYGLAKWYDASNEKNLQSFDTPTSQPRSRIIKAIADANPNSKKLGALKRQADPKSNTYEDPMAQNDFAYGRIVGRTNIQDQLQAERERVKKDQAKWNRAANEQNEMRRDAMEQAEKLIKNTPASPNNIPNNPTNTNVPNASQQPGTAAPKPNASVDDKTGNNQNVFNSIAASLNNNPGYLMPTAIGQTLIAALLGRLLGGKTGMGLGAIMGLLASPLTASYLARNNYLSDIAKPFAETEKGWFNPNKS